MKKIFTCIILFVFICASVLSAYPDRFFDSLAQSDDAKQTTEERRITSSEAEADEWFDEMMETNNRLLNAAAHGYDSVVAAQKADIALPDSSTTYGGTKLINTGTTKPDKYIVNKLTNYSTFCVNVTKSSEKTLKNVNKLDKYDRTAVTGDEYRAIGDLKADVAVGNKVYLTGNKGKTRNADAFMGASCYYKHVGRWKGKWVNCLMEIQEVTLVPTNKGPANMRYGIAFSNANAGVYTSGIDDMVVNYVFMYDDESKATPSGYAQIYDIDSQQGVEFDGSNINNVLFMDKCKDKAPRTVTKDSKTYNLYWTSTSTQQPFLKYSKHYANPYVFSMLSGGGACAPWGEGDDNAWKTSVAFTFKGKFTLNYSFTQSDIHGSGKTVDGANGYIGLGSTKLAPEPKLTIIKKDKSNNGNLDGCTFEIYNAIESVGSGQGVVYPVTEEDRIATEVTKSGGKIVKDFTRWDGQKFIIHETDAPLGYQLDPNWYLIDFTGNGEIDLLESVGGTTFKKKSQYTDGGKNSVKITDTSRTATINIYDSKIEGVSIKVRVKKTDSSTSSPLSGAAYSFSGYATGTGATDDTGRCESGSIDFKPSDTSATITVKETQAPPNYKAPENGQAKEYSITFTKAANSTTVNATATKTTANGSTSNYSVSIVKDGSAYVVEVPFENSPEPPEYHDPDPEGWSEESDKYYISLGATKQDKETNQYLSGARITLSTNGILDTLSPSKVTNGSGLVEWNNMYIQASGATYYIAETNPPAEYYSPDSTDPIRYDVTVTPVSKRLQYYAYSSSGYLYSQQINLKDDVHVDKYTRYESQEVERHDASGNAYMETVQVPVTVEDRTHYLSIDADIPFKFINPPKKYVKINILKKDSKSDEKLNGFKFNVKEENSSYSTTLTTGSSGTTTKGEASTGVIQCAQNNKSCSFTITETGQIKNYFAPRGEQVSSYTISMRTGACTINCADGSTLSNTMVVTGAGTKDNPYVLSVPLEFENDEQPPKIRFKVKKRDRTGNLDLSGAVYTVTEAVGDKDWGEFTTDANGSFDSGVLEVSEENENAKIIIEETTPPNYYKEPEGKQLKKILLEFRNKSKPNVVSYIKTYGDGSTESGEYKSVGVWPKDDVIELTEAIDSEVEHDTNDAIDFRNTPIPFNVKVEKRASERLDGKIAGLKYGLYDKNGNRFLELTDNKDGTYTAKDIDPTAPGGEFLGYYNFDYVVKEERATVKRELVSWEASFKINTMDSVDYEFTRETNKFPDNPPKRGTVKVIKEDNETGERLQYACYEITANEDILVSDYVDSSQYATLGYDVVAPRDIRAKTGELIVKKGSVVTSANQNLKRGTVVGYLVTDASGEATLADQEVTYESGRKLTVKPLYPGKYKISEVEAPEEYLFAEPNDQLFEIKVPTFVDDAIETVTMNYKNKQIHPSVGVTKIADKTVVATSSNAIVSRDAALNPKTGKYEYSKLVKTYRPTERVAYTVTVTNTGDVDLYNVDVKDYVEKDFAELTKSHYFVIQNDGEYLTKNGKKTRVTYGDGTVKYSGNPSEIDKASNNTTSGNAKSGNATNTTSGNASGNGASGNASGNPSSNAEYKEDDTFKLYSYSDHGVTVDQTNINTLVITIAKENKFEGVEFHQYGYAENGKRYLMARSTVKDGTLRIATSPNYTKYDLEAVTKLNEYDWKSLKIHLDETGMNGDYEWGDEKGAITNNYLEFDKAVKGTAKVTEFIPVTNESNVKIEKLAVGDSVDITYLVTFKDDIHKNYDCLNNTVVAVAEYLDHWKVKITEDNGTDIIKLHDPSIAVSKIASRTTGATWNNNTGRYDGDKTAGQYAALEGGGEVVDFRIDTTNTGTVNAYNIIITDTMSKELSLYMDGKMTFDLSKSLLYKYAVSGNASGNATSGNASGNPNTSGNASGNGASGNASNNAANASGNASENASNNASMNASKLDSDSIVSVNQLLASSNAKKKTVQEIFFTERDLNGEIFKDYQTVMGTPDQKLPEVYLDKATFTTKLGNIATAYKLADNTVLIDMLVPGDSLPLCYTGSLIKSYRNRNLLNNKVEVKMSFVEDGDFVELEGEPDDDNILVVNPSVEPAKIADKTSGATFNPATGKYDGTKMVGNYVPGETVVWKMTATNTGDYDLHSLVMTDTLSDRLLENIDYGSQRWGFVDENGMFVELGAGADILSQSTDTGSEDFEDFENTGEFNDGTLNADSSSDASDDALYEGDGIVIKRKSTDENNHSTFFVKDYLPFTIDNGTAIAETALGDHVNITVNEDNTVSIDHLKAGDFVNLYYKAVIKSYEELINRSTYEDDELSSQDDFDDTSIVSDETSTDTTSSDANTAILNSSKLNDNEPSVNASNEATSGNASDNANSSTSGDASEEASEEKDTGYVPPASSCINDLPNTVSLTAKYDLNGIPQDLLGHPDEDTINIILPGVAIEKIADKTLDEDGNVLEIDPETGVVTKVKVPGEYNYDHIYKYRDKEDEIGDDVIFTVYVSNTAATTLYNVTAEDTESDGLFFALQGSGAYENTVEVKTKDGDTATVTFDGNKAIIDRLEPGDRVELHYIGHVTTDPSLASDDEITSFRMDAGFDNEDIDDTDSEDIEDTDISDEDFSDDFGDASENEDINFDESFSDGIKAGSINKKSLNDEFDDSITDDEFIEDDDEFTEDSDFAEDSEEIESEDDMEVNESEMNAAVYKNHVFVTAQYKANDNLIDINGNTAEDGIKVIPWEEKETSITILKSKLPNGKVKISKKVLKTGDSFDFGKAFMLLGAGMLIIALGYVRKRKYSLK